MLLIEEEAKKDFEGISVIDPNCVVVGLSPKDFCYETLNIAMRY